MAKSLTPSSLALKKCYSYRRRRDRPESTAEVRPLASRPTPRPWIRGVRPSKSAVEPRKSRDGARKSVVEPRKSSVEPRKFADRPRKSVVGPRKIADGPRNFADGPRKSVVGPREFAVAPRSMTKH